MSSEKVAPSPKEVATILRQTSRGKLKYDRDWFNDKKCIGHALEEVDKAFRQMKMESVYEATKVDLSFREVTLGPNRKDLQVTINNPEKERTVGFSQKGLTVTVHQPAQNDPVDSGDSGGTMIKGKKKKKKSPETRRRVVLPPNPANSQLMKLELQRKEEVERKIHKRQQEIKERLDNLHSSYEQKWALKVQELFKQEEERELEILRQHEEAERQVLDTQKSVQEAQRLHLEQTMAKLREAEELEKALKEAKEKRTKALKSLHQRLSIASDEFQSVVEALPVAISKEPFMGKLPELQSFLAAMQTNITAGDVDEQHITSATAQVEEIEKYNVDLKRMKEEAEKKIAAAAAKQAAEAQQAVAPPPPPPATQPLAVEQHAQQPPLPPQTQPQPPVAGQLHDSANPIDMEKYKRTMKMLTDWKESCKSVANDRTFKFACQKAVITPVNAISPVSAAHLRDKLEKLHRLLSGQQVDAGGSPLTASAHPQGIGFCKALLAKRFVKQGEDTVSSKPESAFSFAAVMVALWCDFPDFGKLLIGYFYEMCPLIVPYKIPRLESDTDEQYYKKLGYVYDNQGKVEEQNKYVKRMQGIVRLYAAVAISCLPRTHTGKPHPHGLGHIWCWLASTVNLRPTGDVTASILVDVLEVTGHEMYAEYGQQFKKLLQVLHTKFFPIIHEVTPEGSGGPLMRLDQFLQKAIQSGSIVKPAGMLAQNFL